MKPSFRLTTRAYDDLRNIARFTRQQWGESQREKNMRALDDRFHWLAEHPRAGKHRPDIAEGYSCLPQGSHLIFYLIGTDAIDIIGVPHKQMDVPSYFGEVEPQVSQALMRYHCVRSRGWSRPARWVSFLSRDREGTFDGIGAHRAEITH